MVKARYVLLICLVCSFVNASAASEQRYGNPDRSIFVSKAPRRFTIKLKANKTTGYSWFLLKYSKFIEPLSYQYVSPKHVRPGEGGYSLWRFKLKRWASRVPHLGAITFVYQRPWMTKPAKTTTFTVVVSGK